MFLELFGKFTDGGRSTGYFKGYQRISKDQIQKNTRLERVRTGGILNDFVDVGVEELAPGQ